uniref:N-terminal acetyltransferase B complex subunit NAA25 homolog n=1 Tax=Hyaloperonospora arabidopsidis (strain Emoy2) TaxID=559515 RepID=M4C111_HYAAE
MASDSARLLTRYVRPIYEAIDSRQYKTAIKMCMQKRVADLDIVQVLKAHCLERTGRVNEALGICRRLQRTQPTDETLLNTMNLVFKLAGCEHEMLPTFEHACAVSRPPQEELFQSLFVSYVRRGAFLKQQQTALKMFKCFGNGKYVCWAALGMMLQVEHEGASTQMLALAEKMLLKTLRESGSDDGEALQLTVLIMQLQDKHQGALDAFDEFVTMEDSKNMMTTKKQKQMKRSTTLKRAAEGEGAYEEEIELGPMQAIDRLSLEATLAKNVANWTRCAAANRELLEQYNADDWTFLKGYIRARFKEKGDCTAAEMLTLEAELREFLNELQSRPENERIRGPALALIHVCAETLRRLKPKDATVLQVETKLHALIVAYVDRFHSKACCFTDLKQYFALYLNERTSLSAKSNLVQHFSELSKISAGLLKNKPLDGDIDEKTRKDGQSNLSRRLLALKALRFLGYYATPGNFSVDDLNRLVQELEDEYEATNWLNIGSAGGQREVQLTDDLLLLATHFLLDIYQRSNGHREYLKRAAGLLEYGLERSAYNFQMKLLLSRVYGYLGAADAMLKRHAELDVKYVQLDSLSFLVLDKMLDLCQYPEAQKLTIAIAALHRSTVHDTPEYIVRAYRLGVYSKVVDMSSFLHKRMKKSHTLAISKGETLRFKLLDSLTAGPAKLHELVTSLDFGAQVTELETMLASNGAMLSHNQHREVVVDWTSQQQVPTGDLFGQDDAPLVECDRSANAGMSLLWLKLSVLVPKLLKCLADDDHSFTLSAVMSEYDNVMVQLHLSSSIGELQLHERLWRWSSDSIATSVQLMGSVMDDRSKGDDAEDLSARMAQLGEDFAVIVVLLGAALVFTSGDSSDKEVALSPYAVSVLSSLLLNSGLSSLSALALAQRALVKKKAKKNSRLAAATSSLRSLFKRMHESLAELETSIDKLRFTSQDLSKTSTLPRDAAQTKAHTNVVRSYQLLQTRLVELLRERCSCIHALLQK